MKEKSIKELYKIMAMEGLDRKSGRVARERALEEWIKDWIVEVSTSQSVIKDTLSSEEDDFLKYYLAYQIGDRLMDECIEVNSEKRKISTKLLALKR